jgi:hypothetical protein
MSNPHVRELLDVIKRQNAGIERLIAERDKQRQEIDALVGWIQEDRDALMALQQIYNNPTADKSEVIKAAAAALPFERAKPAAVSVVVNFNEKLRSIRLAQLAKDKARWAAEDAAKLIEAKPLDLDAPTPPTILGGDDSAA